MDRDPLAISAVADFWATVIPAEVSVEWQARVRGLAVDAERRRAAADYDTGSISEAEAYGLLALAEFIEARTVIEVGTFIGTSTTVLASASTVKALYTCDVSNDCLPSYGVIQAYPKQTSTQMLRDLIILIRRVQADLCFFDGVLGEEDADLLGRLTLPTTVYAFHDYNYGPKIRTHKGVVTHEIMPRKGIGNVQLLLPRLPHHTVVEPILGTTVALLVPESRL